MFLASLRPKCSHLANLSRRQFHLGSAVLGGAGGYEEAGYDKVRTGQVWLTLSLSFSS